MAKPFTTVAILVAVAVAVTITITTPLVLNRVRGDHSQGGRTMAVTHHIRRSVTATADEQVVIDSSIPETFVSAGPTVTAGMSARAAWQAYARLNGSSVEAPPSDVTVQLGYLTLPVGAGDPGEFTANGQLTWSYHWQSCAPSTGLNPSPAPTTQCVEWLFLDASTGTEIDNTWQQ
ncbi:MAG TPA: hypothetical protein VFI30_06075 [Nocardioidaceae bacterium]|nr:hypothetical protein [Nocardioidaceae bacterium]